MKPAVLFLVHRIPFPPNKGDKIRSFNLLKVLAERYRVLLGAFVDDPADLAHTEVLRDYCEDLVLLPLNPTWARVRSIMGFLRKEPLTLSYYQSAKLQAWVDLVAKDYAIDRVLVFSSSMAQFVLGAKWRKVQRIVDFVDVDSDKWRQYAPTRPWPMSWVYRREASKLLDFERRVIAEFDAGTFVSGHEVALFQELAPKHAGKVTCASNGVDLEYFTPDVACDSPYAPGDAAIVFVGAMDYWPNVDAVTWFATTIFPAVKARVESARFFVVGGNPAEAVSALAKLEGVEVSGRVADVRPYLKHAVVAVAPLRIARGVQNKVLESMALGRPTVVTPAALEGIDAESERDLLLATDAADFADQVCRVITGDVDADVLGAAARASVERGYHWTSNLAIFGDLLDGKHSSRMLQAVAHG